MKHWKTVIALCGSCISLYIGSGFATMQEVLWYKASCRSLFRVVIIATALIYIYTNLSFAAFLQRTAPKIGFLKSARGCSYLVCLFSAWRCFAASLSSRISTYFTAPISRPLSSPTKSALRWVWPSRSSCSSAFARAPSRCCGLEFAGSPKRGSTSTALSPFSVAFFGCVIACLVSYAPLFNVLYGLNGYLGFILVFFVSVSDVRLMVGKRLRQPAGFIKEL